jgi:ribosomal protein L12E/L44/L45/RPP1/RPP2
MPFVKRKAGTLNKKVGLQVDGSRAISLIHEIEEGSAISEELLLDILQVRASCSAGASDSDKQCKVRGDWFKIHEIIV